MNFNDLLDQFRMIRRMLRLQRLIALIPGPPQAALPSAATLRRQEAIILSMTPAERQDPDLLDGDRKARIAAGSGTTAEEVGSLLERLFQIRRMNAHR